MPARYLYMYVCKIDRERSIVCRIECPADDANIVPRANNNANCVEQPDSVRSKGNCVNFARKNRKRKSNRAKSRVSKLERLENLEVPKIKEPNAFESREKTKTSNISNYFKRNSLPDRIRRPKTEYSKIILRYTSRLRLILARFSSRDKRERFWHLLPAHACRSVGVNRRHIPGQAQRRAR